MNYAIYNPKLNIVQTIVTSPTGELPAGYIFIPENDIPVDAVYNAGTSQVPHEVATWKLREICALTTRPGKLVSLKTEIDDIISTLPEPMHTIIFNRWEYKTTIRREDEFINLMGGKLGITSSEIDMYFINANNIS